MDIADTKSGVRRQQDRTVIRQGQGLAATSGRKRRRQRRQVQNFHDI